MVDHGLLGLTPQLRDAAEENQRARVVAVAGDEERRVVKRGQQIVAIFRRLDPELIGNARLRVGPEAGRDLEAAGERDVHAGGDLLFRKSGFQREPPIDVGEEQWGVRDLLDVNVDRAARAFQAPLDFLRHLEILVLMAAVDLDINRGDAAKIENLRDDVGGLEVEDGVGEPLVQIPTQVAHIACGRSVPRLQRNRGSDHRYTRRRSRR